jgi:hypothetical protein
MSGYNGIKSRIKRIKRLDKMWIYQDKEQDKKQDMNG